jgi:hypothetical protein
MGPQSWSVNQSEPLPNASYYHGDGGVNINSKGIPHDSKQAV